MRRQARAWISLSFTSLWSHRVKGTTVLAMNWPHPDLDTRTVYMELNGQSRWGTELYEGNWVKFGHHVVGV